MPRSSQAPEAGDGRRPVDGGLALVRALDRQDWRAYRRIRLSALAESPDAFESTLEREQGFSDEVWRERLDGESTTLAALSADEPVGVVTVLCRPARPGTAHIVGMWVDPLVRGRGVGAQLVEAAVEAAYARGRSDVTLWVVENNRAALRLYERCGFVATGRTQPVSTRPEVVELLMAHAPAGSPAVPGAAASGR